MKRPLDHWGHWIEGFLDAESIFVWYKIPKSIFICHVTIVFYSICHYPFICHYLFWHENYWPGTLTPKCSTRARSRTASYFCPLRWVTTQSCGPCIDGRWASVLAQNARMEGSWENQYENFPSDWWFQYVSMIVYFQHFSTLERGWWSRLTSTKFFASPQPVMGHGLIRMKYGNCYSFFEPGPPIVFYVFLVDAMAHRPWFFHLLSGAKRKLSWQGRLLQAVCMNSARWVDLK